MTCVVRWCAVLGLNQSRLAQTARTAPPNLLSPNLCGLVDPGRAVSSRLACCLRRVVRRPDALTARRHARGSTIAPWPGAAVRSRWVSRSRTTLSVYGSPSTAQVIPLGQGGVHRFGSESVRDHDLTSLHRTGSRRVMPGDSARASIDAVAERIRETASMWDEEPPEWFGWSLT
jgi:hypothetical protein